MKSNEGIVYEVSKSLDRILDLDKNNLNISVLLAVSGGSDSSCLLYVLNSIKDKYNMSISLAHVNYNGKKSSYMEKLCVAFSNKFKIPLYIKNVTIDKSSNFESIARDIRYNFFNSLSKEHSFDYIVTAHHSLDQIETLYMKDQDKCDWISMTGIRFKSGKLIRPMLFTDKRDIVSYIEENKIDWIYDSSNKNIKIRRNYIRKYIMPDLLKNNPAYIKSLYDNSRRSSVRMEKLINRVNQFISKHVTGDSYLVCISKVKLYGYSRTELKFLIQQIVTKKMNKANIYHSQKYWMKLYAFLVHSSSGKRFILRGSIEIINDRNNFFIIDTSFNNNNNKKINLRDKLKWQDNLFNLSTVQNFKKTRLKDYIIVSKNIIDEGVYVRQWAHGDRIITHSGYNIKVKKLLIDNKIPMPYKKHVPIVVNKENTILWIPGIAHSEVCSNPIQPFTKISYSNED